MKSFLPKTKKNTSGFTLIELMVVIAIIAILAVVGLTLYSGAQKSARDSKRKSDIDAVSKALETRYDAPTAKYPPIATSMFAGGSTPLDPLASGSYIYTINGSTFASVAAGSSLTTFTICASMESGSSATFCRNNQQQ